MCGMCVSVHVRLLCGFRAKKLTCDNMQYSCVHYSTLVQLHEYIRRLDNATQQLDELQSSREKEVSHLKEQLERTTAKMGALEGELTEARLAEVKANEVAKGLKVELEKK